MLDLSHSTILIVDFPGACKLRERLLSTGASLHVVKPASALVWARCKKIHAAFISLNDASVPLCEQLAALNVQPIIVTADDATGVASASTSWRSILAPKPARDMAAFGIVPSPSCLPALAISGVKKASAASTSPMRKGADGHAGEPSGEGPGRHETLRPCFSSRISRVSRIYRRKDI